MFCIHCGKSIAENASFCAYCGKEISQISSKSKDVTEWDYFFYSTYWENGKGGRTNLTFGVTEYDVRLDVWGRNQDWIMKELQDYLDEGWQYVTPPGPNSFRFIEHTDYAGSIKFKWLSICSFVVDLRRPAKPLKEKEKELIGVWQATEDPNNGFWKKFGNVVIAKKAKVDKEKITFYKDHTFEIITSWGDVKEGVFYEYPDGELLITFKHYVLEDSPYEDSPINVKNGKLYRNEYDSPFEYERVAEQ